MRLFFALCLLISPAAFASKLYVSSAYRSGANVTHQTATSSTSNTVAAAPAYTLMLESQDEIDTDLQFYLSHSAHKLKPETLNEKLKVTHLQVGGIKYLEEGQAKSYFGVTAGGTAMQMAGSTQFKPSVSIYMGEHWDISRSFALKLETRWLATYVKSANTASCGSDCSLKIKRGLWSQFDVGVWAGFSF